MPMAAKRLRLWGLFKSELAVEETKVLKHFIVVKQGRCLVGNSTATEPGILHMGPAPNPLAESCNTVGCPFVESLKAKFPGIFSVGRLKNYQLKLHIDPPVTPVVQKMRRIPFLGKDKVTAKVDELLENDIIERVERPTTSISPVVVAPKPSGDIRLCIDVRRANEAIVCERLPIHTVKEVLESPNGRKVFSKIGRHHQLLHGRGGMLLTEKYTRMYMGPGQLRHFLNFITSGHIIQDLPLGEKIAQVVV